MTSPQALDGRATGLMLLLCFVWSLQQISLKAAAPDMAPILMLALRSGVAALLVALVMHWRGERLAPGRWRAGVTVGLLFALEYLLLGEGLRHTHASHIVVFLYTAPIFAAIGLSWRLPTERLSAAQWLGIAVAFAGIAITFFARAPRPATAANNVLWGDLLGLLAGAA
ncbi:MAG: EamA family transporter, partial [Burkholderiaceae bacterium]